MTATRTEQTLELLCTAPCHYHGVRFHINNDYFRPNRTTCDFDTLQRMLFFCKSIGSMDHFNVSCVVRAMNFTSNFLIVEPHEPATDSTTAFTTGKNNSCSCHSVFLFPHNLYRWRTNTRNSIDGQYKLCQHGHTIFQPNCSSLCALQVCLQVLILCSVTIHVAMLFLS